MEYGFVMAAPASASKALRYQLNWGDNPANIDFMSTILQSSCIVGIALGSIFGGDFVKKGRRSTIVAFNIYGLIGSAMSIYLNFWVICLGRMILGFCCGVILCVTPKALDEVLPSKLIDMGFGTSTNIMINMSYLQVMMMANFMPDDRPSLEKNKFWMILFTIQVPFQLLAIFLHYYVFPEETIEFNVRQGNEEEAKKVIKKVYPYSPKELHHRIYETKRESFLDKMIQQGS
jgi:MFS family permease